MIRWFTCLLVAGSICTPAILCAQAPAAGSAPDRRTFSITAYGAVGDGKTLCTQAIQQAIDACAAAGGGTVSFPPGTYLSGTVRLKSYVTLRLDAAATLLGSPNLADYPAIPAKTDSRTNQYNLRSVIFAEDLEHIAITGRGTLDGSGSAYKDKRHDGNRPLLMRIVNCRDVLVENIQMRNSGFWNQHYLTCQRVVVRGIRVFNHVTYNEDGIDIDGCRDFVVTDSFIDSDDDAICLKSTLDRPCENVLISNCVVSSHCNAIKMGTDSTGGFVNVTITNCSIISPRDSKTIYGRQRGISGISLELVDGGRIDRVAISNITIDGPEVPLFICLGNRGKGFTLSTDPNQPKRPVGTLTNVAISNLIATGAGQTGCSIIGLPGHNVENVTLSNVSIRSEGGGKQEWASATVKERPDAYPEATMLGHLPAYGLYCRHVHGLTLTDVRMGSDKPDPRHALVLDDVRDANISNLSAAYSAGAEAFIRLVQSADVLIRGCKPQAREGTFLRLEGADTTGIALVGNDLRGVGQVSTSGEGVPASALRAAGNLDK